MTTFETRIKELAEGLGLEIKPSSDGIADVFVEGRVVLLKPDESGEVATIFSILVESADDKTVRTALSFNLFGRKTLGGHLGLFADSIVFSRDEPLANLAAEDLADRIVAFARLANQLAEKLAAGQSRTSAAATLDINPPHDFIRI